MCLLEHSGSTDKFMDVDFLKTLFHFHFFFNFGLNNPEFRILQP